MTTFGFDNEDDAAETGLGGYSNWQDFVNIKYQCPGSGSVPITSLALRCRVTAGTGTMRLGIYDSDGNLVYQGADLSGKTLTNTTHAWIEHTTFVDKDEAPVASPVLTGGAYYYLFSTGTAAGGTLYASIVSVTSGWCKYGTESLHLDLPDALPSPNNSSSKIAIRCDVTVSGGPSIPNAMKAVMF